jgi:beta-1,4-mannosyl-glycoprotein beta-1,4-N-acetylglucosaminyltransferase
LVFNENKELFSKFQNKIIHLILEDAPVICPHITYEKNAQVRNKKYQRDMIDCGLNKLTLHPCDLITITDLDEIPDPTTLQELRNERIAICSLGMKMYYCNLNTTISLTYPWWTKAKIISYETYRLFNLSCDAIRDRPCQIRTKGGWHLSSFGNIFIQNRLKRFANQEDTANTYTNVEKIPIKNNDYLPPKYEIYLHRFMNDSSSSVEEDSHKE